MTNTKLYFYKGSKNIFDNGGTCSDEVNLQAIRAKIAECFDVKNLSFLLGSGCSSYFIDKKQVGIPTMAGLAADYRAKATKLLADLGFSLNPQKQDEILGNIEKLLELLYSMQLCSHNGSFANTSLTEDSLRDHIAEIKTFLRDKCLNLENENAVIDLYRRFYKKLLCRDRHLSRPQIFTTNYDLMSEIAMDREGIIYWNGFTGNVERKFNPSSYKFMVSERLDIRSEQWSAIDNFVLLFKLHGSLNWRRHKSDSFSDIQEHPISQVRQEKDAKTIEELMIYPTPGKVGASLSSPYSDLFREFQSRLTSRDHILMTVGYGFGDEHINNLIYQALTLPSFRLVVLSGDIGKESITELLRKNDPRIWIIGGDFSHDTKSEKIHYFDNVVTHLLPDLPEGKGTNSQTLSSHSTTAEAELANLIQGNDEQS